MCIAPTAAEENLEHAGHAGYDELRLGEVLLDHRSDILRVREGECIVEDVPALRRNVNL